MNKNGREAIRNFVNKKDKVLMECIKEVDEDFYYKIKNNPEKHRKEIKNRMKIISPIGKDVEIYVLDNKSILLFGKTPETRVNDNGQLEISSKYIILYDKNEVYRVRYKDTIDEIIEAKNEINAISKVCREKGLDPEVAPLNDFSVNLLWEG